MNEVISLKNLQEQVAKLTAELAQAKSQPSRNISLKVGQSGTLCLYHGARYPIALYVEQWQRILPFLRTNAVEQFAKANASLLKVRE